MLKKHLLIRKIYQPVEFPTESTVIELPDNKIFADRYIKMLGNIVNRQIKERVANIEKLIKKKPEDQ